MELEFATIHDIADELANRGLQFIIDIQIIDNNEPFKLHICTDSKKNQKDVAETILPFFTGEHRCSDSEEEEE